MSRVFPTRSAFPSAVVILIVATALFASPVPAQTYPFQKYTTGEGLSSAVVRKVFQDSRGLLWFGTQKGVDSYDGRTFTGHLQRDSGSSQVHEIFEDRSGVLWIGTYGSGLIQLHPSGVEQPLMPPFDTCLQHNVTAIAGDSHGAIWVGSDDGLFVFLPDHRMIRIEGMEEAGEIYAIVIDTNRTAWVGTHAGLYCGGTSDPGKTKFRKVLRRPTRSLLLRRNGDVIAGTSGGDDDRFGFVCRLLPGSQDTLLSYPVTKSLIKAQSLFEDSQGTLWVGTGYGLYVIKGAKMVHLRTQNGLQNENIYDIMEDREGTMWFGTENGVLKLARPLVINYGMKDGLTGYVVLSGIQDRSGALWFGMWNGLNRIDARGRVSHWDQGNGLPHHTVRSIAEDGTGRILIGTLRGLAAVRGDHVSRVRIRGLPEELDVWSVYCEPDNTVWVGGGGKLFKTRNGTLELEVDLGRGIPGGAVQVQSLDSRGRLWFLAGGRAGHLDTDGKVRFPPGVRGPQGMEVYSIHKDDNGALRFCTSTGLAVLENDSLRPVLETERTLHRNPVYSVIETGGTTWFGTDRGALAWDGKSIRQLTTADGLASDIVRLILPGHDGTLWFGTHDGVSMLDSSSVDLATPVPEIYLDSALAADGASFLQEQATIPYADRTVVFRFNALSFVAEREMLFQWMVEGFDANWQQPRKERHVRYTNLGPGSYTFKVRAANRNGRWSHPAAFVFTIRPPFWRMWWFIGMSIVVLASILTVAYRFRVAQLLKMERMRRRIAADLHDDIASSLSSVAIYTAVIQQKLNEAPEEIRSLLDRITELSRESMENIGLVVWSVDPQRDEWIEVFRYFQRYAAQVTQAAGVEFAAKLSEGVASVLLTPEQRRTIFLILKESLNNALRHSHCSRIDFACSLHGHTLQLALTDNGSGFSQASTGGHGLQNMRSRGEAIGAHVQVISTPGAGTTVALSLRIA